MVGDLIVQKYLGTRYFGIVIDIAKDLYGYQKNVYIEWAQKKPTVYNEEHGYHGANMHNNRQEFKIIREGCEVL